jgi:hypothetical protein
MDEERGHSEFPLSRPEQIRSDFGAPVPDQVTLRRLMNAGKVH